MSSLVPLGDRAFLARFADEDEAARWARAVEDQAVLGVVDVVLAYQSVGVFVDPDVADPGRVGECLAAVEPGREQAKPGALVTIPVYYEGEDLAAASDTLGIGPAELVAAHTGVEYRVFALGFRPGFPYAGYLPAVLSGLPRRASPRTRVPAGSVAIVGRQTAIYPVVSPGGWHLIGTTPLRIVDVGGGHFPIRAGDRLRFRAIGRDEFESMRGELLRP